MEALALAHHHHFTNPLPSSPHNNPSTPNTINLCKPSTLLFFPKSPLSSIPKPCYSTPSLVRSLFPFAICFLSCIQVLIFLGLFCVQRYNKFTVRMSSTAGSEEEEEETKQAKEMAAARKRWEALVFFMNCK